MTTIATDRWTLVSNVLADAAGLAALATQSAATDTTPPQLVAQAAALLAVREDLAGADGTYLGAVSVTAKARPLDSDHPLIQTLRLLLQRNGALDEPNERWSWVLTKLAEFDYLKSTMRFDALVLLLSGAVTQHAAARFTVMSSKAYAPVLDDPYGDLLSAGFTCTCKGYYSSGGSICKHVLAAALLAFANSSMDTIPDLALDVAA